MIRFFSIFFVLWFSWGLEAQANKRVAVIDIDAPSLEENDRIQLVSQLKESLKTKTGLSLIRQDEISSALIQRNRKRDEIEQLRIQHQNRLSGLEAQVAEGERYYAASEFEEAITVLNSAFQNLPEASLAVRPNLVTQVLEITAAAHYFLGRAEEAKILLATLLDIDPAFLLSAQKFPPDFIELFNSVKGQSRQSWKAWAPSAELKDTQVFFLGSPLLLEPAERFVVRLPVGHPVLGNQAVVLERVGFAPSILKLNDLPQEVQFESIQDRQMRVDGLVAPIGSLTAPLELKAVSERLNAQLVILASARFETQKPWRFEGQWFEPATGRVSPVIRVSKVRTSDAVRELGKELLTYISQEGQLLTEPLPAAVQLGNLPASSRGDVTSQTPFYQKWWFLTALGVGVAAGAGAGAYFLLKKSDTVRFSVQPPS